MLASALDPSALASTYSTEQGKFRPAPQAPRKGPITGRNLSTVAALSGKQLEDKLLSSMHQQQDNMAGSGPEADADMGDGEVEDMLRQWLLEQKAFQKNAFLRHQHMKLSSQVARFQQHLSQKQAKLGLQ